MLIAKSIPNLIQILESVKGVPAKMRLKASVA